MKLLTTRPSSMFMRGPYVLKILAIRISGRESNLGEEKKLIPYYKINQENERRKEEELYQSHVVYGNQTSKFQLLSFPRHSNS